jgi:hypothetical protein
LTQKYPTQKRAGGVAQVVEHLLSKREALNSNPSTTTHTKIAYNNFQNSTLVIGTVKTDMVVTGWS